MYYLKFETLTFRHEQEKRYDMLAQTHRACASEFNVDKWRVENEKDRDDLLKRYNTIYVPFGLRDKPADGEEDFQLVVVSYTTPEGENRTIVLTDAVLWVMGEEGHTIDKVEARSESMRF